MTNKELQDELKKYPDNAEIWLPVYNGHVGTYGVADYVFEADFDDISNDLFGTPGRTDKRIFTNHHADENRECKDKILLLSSKFSSYPNKEVDDGDDDINYDIREINGPDGDPDLVWHINNFKCDSTGMRYYKQWHDEHGILIYEITYSTVGDRLTVANGLDNIRAEARVTGIEDIRNLISACKVPCTLFT